MTRPPDLSEQEKAAPRSNRFAGPPPLDDTRSAPRRRRGRFTPPRWGQIALIIFALAVLLALIASFLTSRTPSAAPAPSVSPSETFVQASPDASPSRSPLPTVAATPPPAPSPNVTATAPPTQPDASLSTIASGSLADPAAAIEALNALSTSDGYGAPSYDRDLFGDRWADVDRNGCDTRNDILGRDLATPSFKPGTRDCKVLTGTLMDPYSGASVEFVSGQSTSVLVQIDHMVALAWAWRQGAYAWTPEQRELFANDPRNLRAASEAMNQSKSDAGPARWLPPAPELQCRFVMEWASVVVDYDLAINPDDRDAAQRVLRSCPAG